MLALGHFAMYIYSWMVKQSYQVKPGTKVWEEVSLINKIVLLSS